MGALPSTETGKSDLFGRFLRMAEVEATVGLRKSKIYELIHDAADPFPAPIHIRAASIWIENEVIAWKAKRVVKSRNSPKSRHEGRI